MGLPIGAGYDKIRFSNNLLKKCIVGFLVVLIFLLNFNGCAIASDLEDANWTKHGVAVQNGDAYDLNYAKNPCVIIDEGIYKMWYAGYNHNDVRVRILFATSTDGIIWTKSPSNPILDRGNPGQPDDTHVDAPKVIKDGGVYKMWYGGNDGSINRIMYASSSDGLIWTKQGVVLTGSNVMPNTIIKDGANYKMWYQDLVGGHWRIYYATSTNGINWTKQGITLDIGYPGEQDDMHVSGSAVIKDGDKKFRMWYSGHDETIGYRIFYATSNNGINWVKQGLVLDQGSPGEMDDNGAAYSCVIKDDGHYKMWYNGVVGGLEINILYASCTPTSEDWSPFIMIVILLVVIAVIIILILLKKAKKSK